MFLLKMEYWVGGDPDRRRTQGWAAATRAFRRGRHEWHVVITLRGQRHSWCLDGEHEDPLVAVLTCLARLGITASTHPPRPAAESERATTRAVTAAVEADLAGAAPCPGPPAGAGVPEPARAVIQRVGSRDRVLAQPHLSEEQMSALLDGERDHDAMLRGMRKSGVLIGLSHNDRKIYPAFQIRRGWLDPIVTAVNVTLRANRDPWAAAIWWTTRHEILGAVPVDLLQDPDNRDRLLGQAAADRL